jgi:preprotein translocase subunit SecA
MSEAGLLRLAVRELASGRPYAERDERRSPWHDELALALWHGWLRPVWRRLGGGARGARRVVDAARACESEFAACSDDALRAEAARLRGALRRSSFASAPSARLFALVREAAGRVLGQRHYDCQLQAGWYLLQGNLIEMATGEGKTFAATLPACAAALVGLPVHVVTVNDYLAARDAEAMAPLYAFFGLSCAAIVHELSRDQRRAVYAGDIVYCCNKELVFDYLRDRSALGDRASVLHRALTTAGGRTAPAQEPVLRGLVMAIVDEADSVFIDEARTPLILSAQVDAAGRGRIAAWALDVARHLRPGADYEPERALMRVRLTDTGRDRIEQLHESAAAAPTEDGLPETCTSREAVEAVVQALAALHLYHRDRHYVVVDDKVQIVDESTGRSMPDRAWERGLHQAIESKEGLPLTGDRATIARITYQRFFRRYLRLAGMTGTGAEVAAEIGRVYGLAVVRVPLNRPSQARRRPPRCLPDADAKWQAVVERVRELALDQGRPVLVGTRTVWASEQLAQRLRAAGIEHVVLNAKQDRAEAEVVALAGQPGRVTVATNMAGRGTDIVLGPGVAEGGGLQVILTEYHESGRIDRQLFGRAARQGDPGGGEAVVALDDEVFAVHAPWLVAPLARALGGRAALPRWALELLRRTAQATAESRHRRMRSASLERDRRLAAMLAFSGRGE